MSVPTPDATRRTVEVGLGETEILEAQRRADLLGEVPEPPARAAAPEGSGDGGQEVGHSDLVERGGVR